MQITEETLIEWGGGFRVARVLFTAVELDVFANTREWASASQVARAIGGAERSTRFLLDALTSLGLLEKMDGNYRNTPASAELLDPASPRYMANLKHWGYLWHSWSTLTEVVRTGSLAPPGKQMSPKETENFIAAMAYRSSRIGSAVAAALNLKGVSRVLDVGGGSGGLAVALVRAAGPQASGTVLDLPWVTPLTRKYLSDAGMSDRIDTVDGDFTIDPLPHGYDLVLMSSIIHIHSPKVNTVLIAKGAEALNPGGQLVVRDYLINEERTGPLQATLFALNMLVNTQEGDAYTESEITGWMKQAGLKETRRIDLDEGASLVIGVKAR